MKSMTRTRLLWAAATLAASFPAVAQPDDAITLPWWTVDCGGGLASAGALEFRVTFGQSDAGRTTGGSLVLSGGFWATPGPPACYANCDGSTAPPILNVNDFQCFLNKFAIADSYANCDGSTVPPVLNVNDFQCFVNMYAAGCS